MEQLVLHNHSGSIISTGNPMAFNNPPNTVLNLLDEPNSDPGSSDSSLLDSYDSSDSGYPKLGWITIKSFRSKKHFNYPMKKCKKLTNKLLKAAYNLKVKKLKLEEDPLQRRFYFLSLIHPLKENYHNLRRLAFFLWNIYQ